MAEMSSWPLLSFSAAYFYLFPLISLVDTPTGERLRGVTACAVAVSSSVVRRVRVIEAHFLNEIIF
jgi:hypothetical protein